MIRGRVVAAPDFPLGTEENSQRGVRIRQAGIGFGEPGLGLDLRLEARDRLTQRRFGRRLSADDRGSYGSNDDFADSWLF